MITSIWRRSSPTTPPASQRIGSSFSAWIGRTAVRHLITILLAAALVYGFSAVHGHWSPMHRWNKATADASIVLLTFTMAFGPAARLWPALRRLIPFRREFGIYAVLLALAHTIIILDGWVEWDLLALAGLAVHPDLNRHVMIQHGFGLANIIGIVALGYGLVLMITSSDRAVRLLSGSVWKFVQSGAYVLWALVVVHTAYFLFMHFLDFHRPLPAPNPLQWPFVGLVVLILALRWAASVQSWRQKRRGAGDTAAPTEVISGRVRAPVSG
jgi:methionine sulfoxide reductase heme-binding subunit